LKNLPLLIEEDNGNKGDTKDRGDNVYYKSDELESPTSYLKETLMRFLIY